MVNSTFRNKDHGIRSHHFMGNRRGNSGNSVRLHFFWAPSAAVHGVTESGTTEWVSFSLTSEHDYHCFDYMDFCRQSDVSAFNMLSSFVVAFLSRSKRFLISWLQSPSAVILEPKEVKSVTASTFPPSICLKVMRPDAVILVLWMWSFKLAFSPWSRGSLVPLHFLLLCRRIAESRTKEED